MANKQETEYAKFEFKDGIIFIYYKSIVFDLEVAKQAVRIRKEISDYTTCPMLVDARNLKELTKEARDYLGSETGTELLKANAVLIKSAFTAYLVNFTIKVNFKKATVPIKMYDDEEKALDWLRTFL